MRKYALLRENFVVSIESLDEIQYREKCKEYQLIIDVEDLAVQPDIGWVLDGNSAKPYSSSMSESEKEDKKMRARFRIGNAICDEAVIKISARNRALAKTSAEVSAIITNFMPIEMALRKCALPTALGGIIQMKPAYTEYEDIFNEIINKINAYLASEV